MQAQARLEQTMQSKIRVYESRTANGPEADPDLPPELASALNLDTGGQQPQVTFACQNTFEPCVLLRLSRIVFADSF